MYNYFFFMDKNVCLFVDEHSNDEFSSLTYLERLIEKSEITNFLVENVLKKQQKIVNKMCHNYACVLV